MIVLGKYYKIRDNPAHSSIQGCGERVIRTIRCNRFNSRLWYIVPVDGKGVFPGTTLGRRKDPPNVAIAYDSDLHEVNSIPLKVGDVVKVPLSFWTTNGDTWVKGRNPSDDGTATILELEVDKHGVGNVAVDWRGHKTIVDPCCVILLSSVPKPTSNNSTSMSSETYCSCDTPQTVKRYAGEWFDFCTACRKEHK